MARPRTVLHKLPKGPGSDLARVLAYHVLARRSAQELSQQQLATKAGISKRSLLRVEGPEGVADLNTLAKLAQALEVKPHTLIQ